MHGVFAINTIIDSTIEVVGVVGSVGVGGGQLIAGALKVSNTSLTLVRP